MKNVKRNVVGVGLLPVLALGVAVVVAACDPASGVRRCNSERDCVRPLICASKICVKPQVTGEDGDGGASQGNEDGGVSQEPDAGVVVGEPMEIDAGPPMQCSPGTECRPAAGACDIAETCGADGVCPGNKVKGQNAECRAADGLCDAAEVCTGLSPECPADVVRMSGDSCRAAAGDCDVAEVCNGTAKACPGDVFAPAQVTCRGANGACDVEEKCTGNSAQCPADGFKSSGVCRPAVASNDMSASSCDVAESCNGTSAQCPPDGFQAGGICRGAVDGPPGTTSCDVAELCTGNSAQCPGDAKAGPTVICRVSNGNECDLPDLCDGNGTCVTKRAPDPTPCGRVPTALECRIRATCGGFESCPTTLPNAAAGSICRPAVNGCDVSEMCNSNGSCAADVFAQTTVACGTNDRCNKGSCEGNSASCNQTTQNEGQSCNASFTCSDDSKPRCGKDLFADCYPGSACRSGACSNESQWKCE